MIASVEAILFEAAAQAGVAGGRGVDRTPAAVAARRRAAARLRAERNMSYPEIAAALGLRSHVSVMYYLKGRP